MNKYDWLFVIIATLVISFTAIFGALIPDLNLIK